MSFGAKVPFVIDGPGEYEVGDVTVRGYGTETTYEGVTRFNTIYQVTLEGINLVFLGRLVRKQSTLKFSENSMISISFCTNRWG